MRIKSALKIVAVLVSTILLNSCAIFDDEQDIEYQDTPWNYENPGERSGLGLPM